MMGNRTVTKPISAAILMIVAGIVAGGIGFLATYGGRNRGISLPKVGSREASTA